MAGEIVVDLFQDSFDGDFVITLRGFFWTHCMIGLCLFSSLSGGRILRKFMPYHALVIFFIVCGSTWIGWLDCVLDHIKHSMIL